MSKPFADLGPQLFLKPRHSQPPSARWLPVWFATMLAGLAVMNFSLLPLVERSGPDDLETCWATYVIGSIGGQAGLLAIGAALGPAGALRRHLFVLPAGLILMLAWLLGLVISKHLYEHSYPPLQDVIAVLLVLPLLFAVCEMPLWFFRTLFRWHIERPAEEASRPPQLTIAGILAATAAVALALGAVRLGNRLGGGRDELGWWAGVGIAAAFCGAISILVLPVVTALVFRSQYLIVGLLVSAGWIGLLLTALLFVVSALVGSFPPTRELHLVIFVYSGFCTTLLGPLALCRHFGYRLLWGKEGLVISA